MEHHHCDGCGLQTIDSLPREAAYWYCNDCRRRYPHTLIKSVNDPFDYVLELSNGRIIYFVSAQLLGDYVLLELNRDRKSWASILTEVPHIFERGIEIRTDAILWCAQAPDGS